MRLLFTALACLLSVSITAQEQVITYPYNPDADTDSLIAVPDMLDLLVLFGNEFIPEPVTVDGVVITEWLESSISNQCCDSLVAVIDSMQIVLDNIDYTIESMINDAILQQIGHGDNYQGGIVAYIFQPGDNAYVEGEVHGYLAYYDNTTIGWGCEGITTAIGVNNTSVGQGPVNTQQLVNTCTESNFAAKWCNDLEIGGNSDWFLPNVSELMLFHPTALYNLCDGCSSITAWTSQEAVVGVYGCSGTSNSCCYPVDFATTFGVNGSGNDYGNHNRKMPGGVGACGGWGQSAVISYRQF